MLQVKKSIVSTLNDFMLGWFDDGTWRPSQVLVGCSLSDEVLGPLMACQIREGGLYSMGKRVATVNRDESGKIVDLTLDAQKL
jgi:hypothetical protein